MSRKLTESERAERWARSYVKKMERDNGLDLDERETNMLISALLSAWIAGMQSVLNKKDA